MPPSPSSPKQAEAEEAGCEILPAVARAAIIEHITGKPPRGATPKATGVLAEKHGVFVTLRDKDGELRGCCGSVEPECDDLIEETRRAARLAACEDSRFKPVRDRRELNKLSIEVSVLTPPERVDSIVDLDPEIYGAILTSAKSGNRGVMLPNVPGLNTVDKQLAAIRRKADLRPDERLRIERFRAEKFTEPEA